MLQNEENKLIDQTTLNILTMILGAVLGGIIAPICNHGIRKLFREKREISTNSALLFLIIANAAWIFGEASIVFLDLIGDIRISTTDVAGFRPTAYIISLIVHVLAAVSLLIAYEHVPKGRSKAKNIFRLREGPLAPFILGNMSWIIGEFLQILLNILSNGNAVFLIISFSIRLFTLIIAFIFLYIALQRTWKLISIKREDGGKTEKT